MVLSIALVISLILTVLINKVVEGRILKNLNWWRQAALELNAQLREDSGLE